MAGVDDLGKQLDDLRKKLEAIKAPDMDSRAALDQLSRVQSGVKSVGTEAVETSKRIQSSSGVIVDAFGGANEELGRLAQSVLAAGQGSTSMGDQFRQAFKNTGIDDFAAGFDELTEMTRNLRGSAIDVGNAFGMSFEQVRGSYQNYAASILLAQENTYKNRQAIEDQTKSLAMLGIGLDDLAKTSTIAGQKQNLLSQGFLLAADSGLGERKTFELMAEAARTMGVSVEDSGRPLVALENIAKDTGLPMNQLADKVFSTAQQFSRLGLTVDGMAPLIKRFTDVLGSGFKGLAIEESTNLIKGMERQINSTNAAFLAMNGGLSRPGAGVAEAQLAFEDAFKNPVEIMKALTTTLSGVTGGKILKFEEARANPELANQFKLQRDLLAQFTGNNDAQSQRTILGLLSDQQSGRQLTSTQNKTLEDSLKSGTQKQEEQVGLQDRIGKAQVGLLTQIALNTSAFFDRLLPAQAQAGFVRAGQEGGQNLENKGLELFNGALSMGEKFLTNAFPKATSFVSGVKEQAMNYGESKASTLRETNQYSIPAMNRGGINLPPESSNSPYLPSAPTQQPVSQGQAVVSSAANTNKLPPQEVIITLRGTDELTRLLANAAIQSINHTNHGGGT